MKTNLIVTFVGLSLCFAIGAYAATRNILDIYRKEVFDYGVLRNNKPVVVFYTSKSCAPCSKFQRNLETIARENSDKMYLAIVDFDKKPELQEQFGIDRIPTTRIYYKGKLQNEVKVPIWPPINFIVQKMLQ